MPQTLRERVSVWTKTLGRVWRRGPTRLVPVWYIPWTGSRTPSPPTTDGRTRSTYCLPTSSLFFSPEVRNTRTGSGTCTFLKRFLFWSGSYIVVSHLSDRTTTRRKGGVHGSRTPTSSPTSFPLPSFTRPPRRTSRWSRTTVPQTWNRGPATSRSGPGPSLKGKSYSCRSTIDLYPFPTWARYQIRHHTISTADYRVSSVRNFTVLKTSVNNSRVLKTLDQRFCR